MKKLKLSIILFMTFMSFSIKSYANINVAFTIDNNYPSYTLLTINSILMNNKSKSTYTFWVIENDVTEENKAMMKEFVEDNHQKINFINISLDDITKGKELYKNSYASYVTNIGVARILLPKILPQDIDKILYLDSDTLAISDLKELYDMDISDYGAAMAKDHISAFNISENKPPYFNSGVILINADYWRENNITQKMITYIQDNEELQFPDQDAVNKVLRGKIFKLEQKWNNLVNDMGNTLTSINDGGILHYFGITKPWHITSDRKNAVKIYYEYWDKYKETAKPKQ